MNYLYALCFLILGNTFLYADSSFPNDVSFLQERLATIPVQDRQVLADFFRGMLSQGDFAATLLGDKPAFMNSWVWWFIKAPHTRSRDFLFLTHAGWRLWQKYEPLFPMHNFAFIDEGYWRNCFGIWFAKQSRKDSIKLFLQNKDDSLEAHKTTGLLLGYPNEEVENYCKEVRILFTLKFFPYEIGGSLLGNAIKLTSTHLLDGYPEDLIEQYRFLEGRSPSQTMNHEPFFPTSSYLFCSENEEWKQKIADLYNSDAFLEEILTLFVKQ